MLRTPRFYTHSPDFIGNRTQKIFNTSSNYLAVINLPIKSTIEVIIFKSGILVSLTDVFFTVRLVCTTVVSERGAVLTYKKHEKLIRTRIAKADFELLRLILV
jgi:hypothetical protein